MTEERYEEIRASLAAGRSVRDIAQASRCSRRTVRRVRDGKHSLASGPKAGADPLWTLRVDWQQVVDDRRRGRPIKSIWAERAMAIASYPTFWRQLRKHSQAASGVVPDRKPAEIVQVASTTTSDQQPLPSELYATAAIKTAPPEALDRNPTLEELFARAGVKLAAPVAPDRKPSLDELFAMAGVKRRPQVPLTADCKPTLEELFARAGVNRGGKALK